MLEHLALRERDVLLLQFFLRCEIVHSRFESEHLVGQNPELVGFELIYCLHFRSDRLEALHIVLESLSRRVEL